MLLGHLQENLKMNYTNFKEKDLLEEKLMTISVCVILFSPPLKEVDPWTPKKNRTYYIQPKPKLNNP